MKVIIVIPCYNEEKRLSLSVFDAFARKNENVDFLFVNDGSTDNTGEMLNDFCTNRDQLYFLDVKQNSGKAGAIRQGVLFLKSFSNYDYVGYFDADLATPLSEINHFTEEIEKREDLPMFVMGARIARMGATIHRRAWRHYIGRIFATLVSMMLRIPVYDTQCGAKMIHKDVIFELFEKPLITKWLFDVELIARLEKKLGIAQMKKVILEIPLLEWSEIEGSKLKLWDFFKAPFELFRIWRSMKK